MLPRIFIAAIGSIAVLVGVRAIHATRIPVVHEGGDEEIGTIDGLAAVCIDGAVCLLGAYLLAAAIGLVAFP